MTVKHETAREAHKREAAEEEAAERKREDREATKEQRAAAQVQQNAEQAQQAEPKPLAPPPYEPHQHLPSINEPPGSNLKQQGPPEAPMLDALTPASCTIGDEHFTLFVIGTGFTQLSVINFAGNDEPTMLEPSGDAVSTGVKPELWTEPVVVECKVRNGNQESNVLTFEFLAPLEMRHEPHQRRSAR